MSAAASTTSSPVIVPEGALSALLAAVAAVDLTTSPAPAVKGRCRHYKAVGPANDFVRRLTLHRNQLIDGLNARKRECRDELAAKAESLQGKRLDATAMTEWQALQETLENELSALQQPVDLLDTLVLAEIVHQYPEVANASTLVVDSDWNVGWYPGHEDGSAAEEFMGSLYDAISGMLRRRRREPASQ